MKSRPNYKAPITFSWDCALTQTNIYSFVLFLLFWVPFGVILAVDNINKVTDKVFYNLAWLAISKSCINSIIYGILNRHFRSAYINLFQVSSTSLFALFAPDFPGVSVLLLQNHGVVFAPTTT